MFLSLTKQLLKGKTVLQQMICEDVRLQHTEDAVALSLSMLMLLYMVASLNLRPSEENLEVETFSHTATKQSLRQVLNICYLFSLFF